MSLFPPSPANGQTTIVNGVSYTYDSTQTAWIRTSSAYAGNLVVTGNLTAVSFIGDGSKLSNIAGANVVGLGNVSSVNLDGSSSNVLYGNGVFAPGGGGSADKIANGTSNVSIPAANGNVNIVAAGNTMIAVSGTGANVNGTLYSTGNIIGQYIYGNGAFLTGISGGSGGGGSASTLGDVSGDLVSVNSPSPNYYLFKMVVVPEDFTITKIAFETSAATPGCTYAPAVYSSSTSGDPSTLLASGPSVSGVVDGYNEAPLTTPLTVSKGDILFLCINQTGSAITMWNSGGLGAYLTNGGNVTPAATVSGAAFLSGYGSVYGIWGVGTGSGGGGNAASIANGTSNVSIPSANGNVNIVAAGNSVAAFSGTGANITGALYTTGNITGQYLFGNGAYLTGISGGGGGNANNISSGSSNVDIASANANVTFSVNGTSNVVVVSNNAVGISGNVTATRFISNVSQGTAPFSVSSNTKVTNLNADLLDGYTASIVSSANTVAIRDANANIAGNFFIGNGSQLTGITTSITANGTSNVSIPSSGGNVTISVDGTSNVAVVTSTGVNVAGTMTATGNVSGTNLNGTGFVSVANGLVSTANYGGAFTNGVVVDYSGSNVRISTGTGAGIRFFNGGVGNVNLMTLDQGGNANVTGNVNAAYFNGNGAGITGISVGSLANGTSSITIPAAGGNINFSPAGIANVFVVSASGTTVSGNLTSTGNVISGSGSGGTISGANLVSANLLQGSLITASQPNVTSVGSLTSLTVAGNSTTTGYTITAVTTGIAANGSSQTDATVIASPYNVVSTVSTGQGVVLPTPVPGTRLTITNTSANALSVYPAANGAINALSINAAFSLASATTVDFLSATATQWYTK